MKRIGLFFLLVAVLSLAGCMGRENAAPAPARDRAVQKAEDHAAPSGERTPAEEVYSGGELNPTEEVDDASAGVVLKTETPVADPEAERILQELEKEIDSFLQVIEECEKVADEDLEPGVTE